MSARHYTMEDHDSNPEEGGEVRYARPVRAAKPATDPGLARRMDLAQQMVEWMQANQHPSYKITGRVWAKGGFVRVYTSVGSYAELTQVVEEDGVTRYHYEHVGVNRGSVQAIDSAWEAAK